MGVPKFSKFGFLQLWGPITLCVDLRLRWGLKESCSPHHELFNNMCHATCMQINRGDFLLLVVRSQIAKLTLDPSFVHNLCFNHSNGSCEPNLFVYVPNSFQWFKECFNQINFDPYNRFLNIQESIRTPIPKVGVHLECGGSILTPSHILTLSGAWNVTPELPSWPTTLQALALVASPRLGLRHVWWFNGQNIGV